MSSLRRRVRFIEEALGSEELGGGDANQCPLCVSFAAKCAKIGLTVLYKGSRCPGHPIKSAQEAKAEADKALSDLWAKISGNR